MTKKTSKTKTALICLVGLALILLVYVFLAYLEKRYCWNQGKQADPTGLLMVPVTADDAAILKDLDVHVGDTIGVAYRKHKLCHATYSLFRK